jgi:hypothetical protein
MREWQGRSSRAEEDEGVAGGVRRARRRSSRTEATPTGLEEEEDEGVPVLVARAREEGLAAFVARERDEGGRGRRRKLGGRGRRLM